MVGNMREARKVRTIGEARSVMVIVLLIIMFLTVIVVIGITRNTKLIVRDKSV
jgi:hypothetical protein